MQLARFVIHFADPGPNLLITPIQKNRSEGEENKYAFKDSGSPSGEIPKKFSMKSFATSLH
jgi:hypothetical protein